MKTNTQRAMALSLALVSAFLNYSSYQLQQQKIVRDEIASKLNHQTWECNVKYIFTMDSAKRSMIPACRSTEQYQAYLQETILPSPWSSFKNISEAGFITAFGYFIFGAIISNVGKTEEKERLKSAVE